MHGTVHGAIQQEEIQSVWDGIAIDTQSDKPSLVDCDQVAFIYGSVTTNG